MSIYHRDGTITHIWGEAGHRILDEYFPLSQKTVLEMIKEAKQLIRSNPKIYGNLTYGNPVPYRSYINNSPGSTGGHWFDK